MKAQDSMAGRQNGLLKLVLPISRLSTALPNSVSSLGGKEAIYTMGIGKSYIFWLFFFPLENWLLNIYQHTTRCLQTALWHRGGKRLICPGVFEETTRVLTFDLVVCLGIKLWHCTAQPQTVT